MLALLLALLSGAAHSNAVDGGEEWDWSRTHTWMLVNIRGSRMSPYQAQFSATNYDIVGVGGIFDGKPNSGEVTQAAAAMQLKQINPNVTVLIYRNSGIVIEGELDSDLEFAAHPEWILQDATGSPIYNNPPSTTAPLINFTNPAAREWWVSSTVAAITGQPNGTAIDGVFIDGAGPMDEVLSPRLAPGQNTLLNASHTLAVRELTERLHALRPGMITLGNGAVVSSCGRSDDGSKWGKMDWAPCARNLPWLDGVCAEHFGSFESVNTTTGGYDTDGGIAQNHKGGNVNEKWQTALDIVREFDGGSKISIIKSWPGPLMVYKGNQITWKNFSDANITLTNMQKKEHGRAAFPWAHAAYLLAAAPNTYMSYGWWYQLSTGYVPCPDDPTSCSCPDEWYPNLSKPTGKPLGPRRRVGTTGHVWARDFEKLSVQVDLANFSNVQFQWK